MTCIHANAVITLYEEKATEYTLREGTIEEIDDDIEAQPLHKVSLTCPDCDLTVTYPDWRQAPEPCLSAIRSIYQQEYGFSVESYRLVDATTLHTIKNRLRDITKMVDALTKVYPTTIEASQVKHETVILLTELQARGLLPVDVKISQESTPLCEQLNKSDLVPHAQNTRNEVLSLRKGNLSHDRQSTTEQS